MGNHHYLMDAIAAGEDARVRDAVGWLLNATKGYGIKVVNPAGVERWKQGQGNAATLDDNVSGFGVTPRAILLGLATAVDSLRLPHPMHFHGLNLGLAGNAETTLETMRALDGHRVHLAHIQFHSYAAEESKSKLFGSGVEALADHVNTHDRISVDVGQVLFGETTSMTADGALGYFLARLSGRKWLNIDIEMETGCGVVPVTYRDRNYVHGLQWAIGLEWFLRVEDPWRLALSTDHPNGASFLSYPQIIALLMDRGLRNDTLATLPKSVQRRTRLADLSREYSLSEIAVITRAAPARILGLSRKGHLGVGADADVTVYSPDHDKARMFSHPRYVIKAGEIVVDDGELQSTTIGKTHFVEPTYDAAILPSVKAWFENAYSLRFANYQVRDDEVANPSACPILSDRVHRGDVS
jgi:formylmethanofuran dehydrogenase subunit A